MAAKGTERPDYNRLAASLIPAIERLYAEPENERAFQEWKRERENKKIR
jgi:aspartate-semialdehyde dehydrogenase